MKRILNFKNCFYFCNKKMETIICIECKGKIDSDGKPIEEIVIEYFLLLFSNSWKRMTDRI